MSWALPQGLVNVEGARRVGMKAVEFTGLPQARPEIEEIIAMAREGMTPVSSQV